MQKSFLRRRKEQNKTRRLSGFYGFFTLVLARRCWGKPQDQSAHPCHIVHTQVTTSVGSSGSLAVVLTGGNVTPTELTELEAQKGNKRLF